MISLKKSAHRRFALHKLQKYAITPTWRARLPAPPQLPSEGGSRAERLFQRNRLISSDFWSLILTAIRELTGFPASWTWVLMNTFPKVPLFPCRNVVIQTAAGTGAGSGPEVA